MPALPSLTRHGAKKAVRVDEFTLSGQTIYDVVADYVAALDADLSREERSALLAKGRADMSLFVVAVGLIGPPKQRPRVTGQRVDQHTLLEVVVRYLGELDNPAPDFTMRSVYRDWMREFLKG